MTGDGSRVQCCKEQYCVGTWNVRSMNQGKLELVKQEMARENVDILAIRKLKWTGMGEFNWNDHYIYYCGQKSLRRNGVAIMVSKRIWNAVLGCSLKNHKMISVRFQGKPFNITVIQSMPQPVMLKKLKLNGWGIDLDYCDIEWFALEMNRDHSVVFEIASKYCISDSFVNPDGYSISSEGSCPQ